MATMPVPSIPSNMTNLLIADDDYNYSHEPCLQFGELVQEKLNLIITTINEVINQELIMGTCAGKLQDFNELIGMLRTIIDEQSKILSQAMQNYTIDMNDADDALFT